MWARTLRRRGHPGITGLSRAVRHWRTPYRVL